MNIRMLSMLGQRGTVGHTLLDIAKDNEKLMVLTGDLLNTSGLGRLQKQFPDKFINTGIAEQNMVGLAAGLASEGFIPFATTFATFASMRCLEQVRVNLGYMNLNVKMVGLASGFAMGQFGNTHYGLEDLSIMRSIPNLTVLSPADCLEVKKCIEVSAMYEGPVYIRLTGTMNNPIVYTDDYDFQIGKGIELKAGDDAAIIATGSMVFYGLEAAKILEKEGINCSVVNINTLKPFDKDILNKYLHSHKYIISVEEHNIIGGLGSAVAGEIAQENADVKQLFIGVEDQFSTPGSYEYLLKKNELESSSIAKRIKSFIHRG